MNTVTITAELTDAEAWAFAQLLKRVGLSDYMVNAVDADEARVMQQAGEKLRRALGEAGYAPR